MSEPKKYIIHDDVLYEEKVGPLITSYTPFRLQVKEPNPTWNGPKIPWDLWTETVAWCQITQEKFGSEALVLLFFDQELQQWSHWYPPQITNGMTVSADEDDPNYKEQRKLYPDLQFGTLHHHCNAGAFASGTDKSDEEDREGLHFTIGHLGSNEHSVHFRFCYQGQCYDKDPTTVIEGPEWLQNVPERHQDKLLERLLVEPVDTTQWDFTEPLKQIKKKSLNHQVGIGFGAKKKLRTINSISDFDHFVSSQKNITDEVVEEIENLLFIYNVINKIIPTGKSVAKKALNYLQKKFKQKAYKKSQQEILEQIYEIVFDCYSIQQPEVDQFGHVTTMTILRSIVKYESQNP
jgi:hypothetical protein